MFGLNIRKRRLAANMTISALAKEAGCDNRMIEFIEQGVRVPSLALATAIAGALHCTVDDLVQGND